ncbi:MAG: hypothetical protein ABI690_19270 [Chloroflexota bacterium]
MTITTSWMDSEKTIARYELVGRWTWEEMTVAIKEMYAMLDSVPHAVDIIIDLSQSPSEPPRGMLAHLRTGTMEARVNWNSGVFVGVSPFVRVLINTFRRVEPGLAKRYAVANTVDEALTIILKRRTEKESG